MGKAPWNDYPPIEECTDMGDTNRNFTDISFEEIDKRIITLDKELLD